MRIYNKILRYGIYPAMEKIMKTNTLRTLAELEKSQWWRPEELEIFQEKKLSALIKHAYDNVPYYHRIFDERGLKPENIKKLEDLQKLPILRKEDIRNNFDELIAQNIERETLDMQVTGGSTGEPLKFLRNKSAMSYNRASAYRGYAWAGLDFFGDCWISLWGSPFDISRRNNLRSQMYYKMMRHKILPMFAVSDQTMEEYARIIRRFKPKMMRGYASSLYIFADFLERKNIDYVSTPSALSTAECLHKFQKEKIEKQLHCEVFDGYGCREFTVGQDCDRHEGIHIFAENLIVECIDDEGEPLVGRTGRFIITDFANHAMPFIRYDCGDMGSLKGELCSCGRCLPLIKTIDGRTSDVLVTTDGGKLPHGFIPHLFKDIADGIRRFQVIQEKKDRLVIKIVKTRKYSKKHQDYILRNIRRYAGSDMAIDIEFVNEIPLRKSGKQQDFISKIKIWE